ncbi:ribonuclease R [Clostridium cellulovorans]|uniref:Ribonuclease R n=1 Tax=Clostridium cellulovorans (strain ATCC 35296 / DSM 3052 / OCM 3 / 743B) TaxID=573061 RepID=D9SRY6_CLOC7|nr:ribonuclease R [Clostridium cellulovorans]ADL50503.1 ribonuclease R [Clostridium cellulovorans 743B]
MGIKGTLLSFMNEQAYKPMDIKELARIFDIRKKDMHMFQQVLDDMEKEGTIIKTRTENYGVPARMNLIIGKLQGHSKGFGFVIPDEEGVKDVFIPSSQMGGAIHGDRVVAKITFGEKNGKKCEGEIIRILERNTKEVIGTYEDSRNFGFVIPEDKRISFDIFVPKNFRSGAKTGQVVICEILEYPDDSRRNPEGKIKNILGNKGDKGIDILTIIKKHGLPEEFPAKVLDAAESIDEEIPDKEIARRRDLRDMMMVTIDGEDAKDLDDAVSLSKLDNGNYYLGVHIADVTHYVKESSKLDNEAFLRGTSTYLIDRVIPMLPRKLSNGVCSLNPKVDRLTLTCFMEINDKGKVENHEIVESIIKTNARMTYTNVTKILRDKDQELIEEYKELVPMFQAMEELQHILEAKRKKRGAVDFDFQECKIILNEMGKPVDIKPYERAIANKIIEEFMLACNETIAEHMFWSKMPFVYRIHEEPNEEKLEHFNEFARNLGYVVKKTKEVHPKHLQEIVEQVKGKKEETVINTLLLRSMMQARYSPESLGHFGLAAKYYCHFTSPIRRYPDLQIHRIIKSFINGKIDEKYMKKLTVTVEKASLQSSERERAAQDAEREVDDLKKAEYMSDRIGEVYEGIISSVTNFGMFVELENTVEGLIHISTLNDDYYVYDEDRLWLLGERTKNIYRLGDSIKIIVDKVDLAAHEIYFEVFKEDNIEDKIEEYKDEEEKFFKGDKKDLPEAVKKQLLKDLETSLEDQQQVLKDLDNQLELNDNSLEHEEGIEEEEVKLFDEP